HVLPIVPVRGFADKQIPDHALVVFIYKERVTEYPPTRYRRVSRQKFRIHVTQNHLRRAAVVPAQLVGPQLDFIVQQRTQIRRRKVSEVENLHRGSCESTNSTPEQSLVAQDSDKQTPGTWNGNASGLWALGLRREVLGTDEFRGPSHLREDI